MNNIIRSLFCAALLAGFSTGAFAQATRTWVSGVGDDANPCSRTAPCKTFAGAISKTATGGEISVLDPGGFGAVTITKSITINGTGSLAGILAALTNGVIVNAAGTSTVILRDISINGATNGLNGIRFLAGRTLMVDHCWIYGFTTHGIDVALTDISTLKVVNSVFENMGQDGIHINSTAGQANAVISNTEIMNCSSDGIEAVANNRVFVSNSRIFQDGNGIRTTNGNSVCILDDVFIGNCGIGLQSTGSSAIRVSDSVLAQNTTGLSPNGGVLESFQGNSLMGNTTPGTFTGTTNKQ